MNVPYESRDTDFYYRSDDNLRHPLACAAHLHYHIELFYLIGGKSRVYIDSTEYTVEQGDVLVVFPNQIHRYECIEQERYLLFILNPDMMPELEQVFNHRVPASALVKNAADNPSLLSLLQLLAALSGKSGSYNNIAMKGAMLAFFGQLLGQMELTEPAVRDLRAIREIVDFCAKNYTAPSLTLETLENTLHLSRFYISHLFSHKLNIRFNDYINSLRVSGACRLLRQTDLSITEIGERSGFNTSRTFNRSFAKQMGLSPSDYRRAVRESDTASKSS